MMRDHYDSCNLIQTMKINHFLNVVVAIILGVDIFEKDEAYYTVIGYACFLAAVLIIMEISKFLYERSEETIEEGT